MASEAMNLGQRIIEINRKVRLGDTTMEQWTNRVGSLLAVQPDTGQDHDVENMRAPEGGAGSSSGTLFFDLVGKRDGARRPYVLRFLPAEQLFHSYDLSGQVRIQRGLADSAVPVAGQCWEDMEGRHLGGAGYIMERASGEAAPGAWFAEGVIARAAPAERRTMVLSFVQTLAAVHGINWRAAGLSFLLDRAQGEGLIAREINWYWDGLIWADESDAMARFAPIRGWLLANQPSYDQPVLCHGDANFTNYLFREGEVSAVLDWEMAFIGTPECDLTYATHGMASLTADFPEGVPTREEMYAAYEQASGRKLQHLAYYDVFSLYRIVLTHYLGFRAFPADFRAAFADYVDSLIAKLNAAYDAARD